MLKRDFLKKPKINKDGEKIQTTYLIGLKLHVQYSLLEQKESPSYEEQVSPEEEKLLQKNKDYNQTVLIPDELILPPEEPTIEKSPVKKIGQKNNS